MDPRIRPRAPARFGLWTVFFFQLVMAFLVVWFVILGRGAT
jgi:hypothetical protein